MRIAVAGGTGAVGRHVVEAAEADGHDVRVISRSTGVDLRTGDGLDEALRGVDVVIDASNVATVAKRKSVAFFTAATTHLVNAGQRAGVGHHLALSIAGIDRVPFGYYEGKRVQERLLAAGGAPWSVLRATQFHEFAGQVLERAPGPVALVPRMRSATVAAAEVGRRLVEIATGPPMGLAPEYGGPEVHEMPDLARRLLRRSGSHRLVVPLRLPGATGRRMADGSLLPTGDGPRGHVTFDEWLSLQTGGG